MTQEWPSVAFQVQTLWSVDVMGFPAPAAVPSAAPTSAGVSRYRRRSQRRPATTGRLHRERRWRLGKLESHLYALLNLKT